MTTPRQSTCAPWATADDAERLRGTAAAATPGLDDLLSVATDLLYEATGRRWPGSCEDVVRPCAAAADGGFAWHGSRIVSADTGNWNPSWGVCGCQQPRSRACGCAGISQITLGGEPVTEITEVLVDGDVLDPARYTIDDDRWLVRLGDTDGTRATWPCCQDLTLPPTEPGTWQAAYTYGAAPPEAGVLACVDLALEVAKATASGDCALPPRITSMVRQGVQVALIDPLAVVAAGGFGVYTVDLFIARFPKTRPATVLVPGRGNRLRRRTGS